MLRHTWQRWRTWSARSPNRRIAAGVVTIGLVTVLAKSVAFIKELSIAAYFGRSDQIEAFLLAILLPQALGSIIGGSFQGAVIPALTRAEQQGGRSAADQLFGQLLSIGLLFVIGLSLLLAGMGHWVIPAMAGGFSPEKLALSYNLYITAVPIMTLSSIIFMLNALFHGRERFAVAALTPGITPALILASVLWVGAEVHALMMATIIGLSGEIIVLVTALIMTDHRPWPKVPQFIGELPATIGQWWPGILASIIHGGVAIVDQVMAAHLVPGSVAALTYAQRIIIVPLGLVLGIVGPAFLAVLSRSQHHETQDEIMRIANWWRRRLLWLAAGGSVAIMLFAPWLTEIILERGSFTSVDTVDVAIVVAALAPIAPWFLVGIISIRLLNVYKGNSYLPMIAAVNLMASIIGNLTLAPLLGVAGIAIASALVYLLSFLQIEWHLQRLIKNQARSDLASAR